MERKMFVTIKAATEATGLAQCYLRKRCKDNTILRIMAGTEYLIDLPALMEQLHLEVAIN